MMSCVAVKSQKEGKRKKRGEGRGQRGTNHDDSCIQCLFA